MSNRTVFEEESVDNDAFESQISARDCLKSLCVAICQSIFIKLIILMLSLYFGGLIWFFYSHATSWTQLYHLCHESSSEFISNVYDNKHYYQYPSFIYDNKHKSNLNNLHKCDKQSFDMLTCEMERQQQEVLWSKTNKNRDHCTKNVRDENFKQIQIQQQLIDKHKHNTLNQLLSDINSLSPSTLSMQLNVNEMKTEFMLEYNDCNLRSGQYLTSFAPILGFHVLCFYSFAQHSQLLVIAYQHGYSKKKMPSIPYKNRKRCIVRNIVGNSSTYYVTNECEREITLSSQSNPKYLLISIAHINSMKSFRRHLQNNLINDIGSHDQYTIEGFDIYNNNQAPTTTTTTSTSMQHEPTKSPETEKLYDKLELKRNPQRNHNNNNIRIISQYKKNPFGLYYPHGESIENIDMLLHDNMHMKENGIFFMFEGGRFMWPGINIGHMIRLGSIGPNIKLKTINMRPLIFEIIGLISAGEVEYICNKSLPRFNRSEVGLNEEKKVSESRTCESAWLYGEQDIIVNSLKNRCSKILQIPKNHMEDMEVVQYKSGQRFDMHYDAFQQHDANSQQSQILLHGGFKNRIATILYYLSNISMNDSCNGYTVFPRYDLNIQFDENGVEKYSNINSNNNNRDSVASSTSIVSHKSCCNGNENDKYGLKIKPKNGKTILFYNMLANGELDPAALHGGCVLNYGQKWAANQWIWNRPFNQ